MSVRIFVEGGGTRDTTRTACRKAFRVFFEKLLGDRPKPRIIACGSRNEAYRDFCTAMENEPGTFAVLLVDSEGPIPVGKSIAVHLEQSDRWKKPLPMPHVHLMVQCMETWFLADVTALAEFYGSGFKQKALPPNPHIEDVPKRDVIAGLASATVDTKKGQYHKTRHGFELLERIDPNAVARQSPFASELFKILLEELS